jgi:hypothetical protein
MLGPGARTVARTGPFPETGMTELDPPTGPVHAPAGDPGAANPPMGTQLLRAVAEAMYQVRHALEHGDVPLARHAARHLVANLDLLPGDRDAYEALCEEADRELAANPAAWDRGPRTKTSS